ncbi:MAG: nitrogen system component [Sphaerochaeta sp.]|nr:nitrogen system component [Sphaerochaeta sp.]
MNISNCISRLNANDLVRYIGACPEEVYPSLYKPSGSFYALLDVGEMSMRILDYLNETSILFLKETHKDQILTTMAKKAAESGYVSSEKAFVDAILERETIMSTGIGLQVAIPHAKMDGIKEFFVLAAVLEKDVPWDSLDKKPVRLVFMIGGPSDRQSDYLMILSKITLVIKNPERRKALMAAKTPQAVLDAFADL